MEWLTLELLKEVGGALGALGGIIVFWRKVGMNTVILRCWRATLGSTSYKLTQVLNEVRTNGGGSLKDVVLRMDERQRFDQARSNAVMNADPRATFEADVDGHFLNNNAAHHDLTGFTTDDMAGDGWVNVIHRDDRSRIKDLWEEAIESQRTFSEQILYVRPSGREYLVNVKVTRQIDNEGTLHGWFGIVTLVEDRV